MSMSRTDYRKERRTLLKGIFDKLWIIQQFNDTDLEKIKRQFFINLDGDLDTIIKKVTYGERYVTGTHIYVNGNDEAPKT